MIDDDKNKFDLDSEQLAWDCCWRHTGRCNARATFFNVSTAYHYVVIIRTIDGGWYEPIHSYYMYV